MVVSTISTVAGAAGRTEGEIASDTLAEISLVALVDQSAVLTLLWEIVAVATCKEILNPFNAHNK